MPSLASPVQAVPSVLAALSIITGMFVEQIFGHPTYTSAVAPHPAIAEMVVKRAMAPAHRRVEAAHRIKFPPTENAVVQAHRAD